MGEILLIRPDPQILWDPPGPTRSGKKLMPLSPLGDGRRPLGTAAPAARRVGDRIRRSGVPGLAGLRFRLKPMGFQHTGLFPEQAVNWERMAVLIRGAGRPVRVLNLFGYTAAPPSPVPRPGRA